MRASKHPELGRVVGLLMKTAQGYAEDPISHSLGFYPDPMPDFEEIVRKEGFANLHHFAAVVAQRTNLRWVHFNLPC